MAFESLTDRLAGVFKKLRGHGKLTEADIIDSIKVIVSLAKTLGILWEGDSTNGNA